MKKKWLFEYQDYKIYLLDYIKDLPKRGYGFKSQMAETMDCKTSYITQVLKGYSHFNLEQAELINGICKHTEEESEYFLNLVSFARAGTDSLRQRFKKRLQVLQELRNNLKERFAETKPVLSEQQTLEFFSLWHISALQIAATIPHLQYRKKLQEALGISNETFKDSIEYLLKVGLIREEGNSLKPGPTKIFIGKDSQALKVHHANWRQRAIGSLDGPYHSDLHFTSVFSLSKKDANLIKERIISEVAEIRQIVKTSPEEELHTFTIDFFRVDKS